MFVNATAAAEGADGLKSKIVVEDSVCQKYESAIGTPPVNVKACHTQACAGAPRWDVGDWENEGKCSVACGGGTVKRTVRCVEGAGAAVTALEDTSRQRDRETFETFQHFNILPLPLHTNTVLIF